MGRIAFTGNRVKDSQEHDAVLMKLKLQLLRKLTERKTKRKKISALMDFLRYYVCFENEENNVKFEQEIQEITGRSETMGIQELMLDRATKQGEQKKSHDVVENLLSKLGLSDEQAAEVGEVSIEFVQKIRAQLNKKKKLH